MILTATRASASDSIIRFGHDRVGSGEALSEELPKVPFISSSGMSARAILLIYTPPKQVSASYITLVPPFEENMVVLGRGQV